MLSSSVCSASAIVQIHTVGLPHFIFKSSHNRVKRGKSEVHMIHIQILFLYHIQSFFVFLPTTHAFFNIFHHTAFVFPSF